MRLLRFVRQWFGRPSGDTPYAGATRPQCTISTGGFLTARDEFMNAFGDLAKGKRNWQVMAFALTGLLGVVTIAYIRLAESARVVPYVVQVDRLGQIVAVGAAQELERPDQRLVVSELARFVRAIRTVLPAQAFAAQAELLQRGYALLAPQAAGFLNEYFAQPEHDPRVLGTRLTREVSVASVLRVPNSDVWRLQWTETERALDAGGPTRTLAWEAYVSVTLIPPRTADAIEQNPLGLAITSLSWTQLAASAPVESSVTPDTAPVRSDTNSVLRRTP